MRQSSVPRFFFNVHDGLDRPDEEGTELRDREAVRPEALRAAGEMLRDIAETFNGDEWRMEVKDEAGPVS
jgi:hypothetical protein